MHARTPRKPAPARIAATAALVAALVASSPACAAPSGPRVVIESGGKSLVVRVELADTPQKREQGLM